MTQEQKNKLLRKTILRLVKALHNACNQGYKENNCEGCKFKVSSFQCALNGHPINWQNKFK